MAGWLARIYTYLFVCTAFEARWRIRGVLFLFFFFLENSSNSGNFFMALKIIRPVCSFDSYFILHLFRNNGFGYREFFLYIQIKTCFASISGMPRVFEIVVSIL